MYKSCLTRLKRLLIIVLTISFSLEAFSAQYQTKALQIRLREPAKPVELPTPPQEKSALQVSLTPLQTAFQVNESIRFNVKANRPFYMYLFSIDDQNDEAILLLPHKLQHGNKYPANQTMLVPNVDIEFYADQAGKETLMMIASENYFDWDTSGYTEASIFLKTPLKRVRKQLKKLNVRPANTSNLISTSHIPSNVAPGTPDDIFVKEVSVDILSANPVVDPVVQRIETIVSHSMNTSPVSDNVRNNTVQQTIVNNEILFSKPPIATATTSQLNAFVHTDKQYYQLGEPVKIIYGANRSGWLHLMSFDGENIISQSTTKVEASKIHELAAMASLPTGLTQVAAIYTATNKRPSKDGVQALFKPKKAKGLINHQEDQLIYSKTHFYVSE